MDFLQLSKIKGQNKMDDIKKKLICEVCNTNEAIGVAAIPGIPMSVAYCKECLEKDSYPMWALISYTACCNGLDHCAEWWKEIVGHSLKAQGKTIEWFNAEVKKCLEEDFNDNRKAEVK
jgi:hypothetical protein